MMFGANSLKINHLLPKLIKNWWEYPTNFFLLFITQNLFDLPVSDINLSNITPAKLKFRVEKET